MNTSYSTSHSHILQKKDRMRVAEQLLAILRDRYTLRALKNLNVLDYGCSSGVITRYLSRYFAKTTGYDVDREAIEQAKRDCKKSNLSFYLGQGIQLPYEDSTFDLVICNQVYSYLDDPRFMMKEIHRVLKSNGFCLFTGDNLLRLVEPLYGIPFIRWIPRSWTSLILKFIGHKNIYLGKYKSYWGMKELFKGFTINDYTLKVLRKPRQFKYSKLYRYESFIQAVPFFFFVILKPFSPSFIYILKKDSN